MPLKRVLVVDDDKDLLTMLEFSLKRLGADYEVHTARGSIEAMEQVESHRFDLVVADYMMPGMTGIDLARAVRQMSPDTQIVLMTAFGNQSRVRETTKHLGLDGYLSKPFTTEEIHQLVMQAGKDKTYQAPETRPMGDPPVLKLSLLPHLKELHAEARAQCVLLVNQSGQVVLIVGDKRNIEPPGVAHFVAKTFRSAKDLTPKGEEEPLFRSSYHEGSRYNLYAYAVNYQFSLAVISSSGGAPGPVWLYTKKAAKRILDLLPHTP